MAFTPISNAVIQYSKNASGASASDYYLKLYAASTSTPISMYSLADGTGALGKCQINSLGFPVNGSDAVFIPYIDQDYRMVLYTNSTDADANTFANAAFDIDDIPQSASGLSGSLLASNGSSLITHTDFGIDYVLATYLQNRHVIYVEDFGADGTGVTECAVVINSAIEYGRANRIPVRANGKYNVASTILFAAGRHDFSMSPIVNIFQATDQGFKWSGVNSSTIVEIIDVKDSLFGTFTISGQTATGMLGLLQHASDATLYGHNVFDRICVQNTLYGIRLGDYTNDGYDSNVEQNVYRQMYFYSVDNPLLLDSDSQDLIRIDNFIVGGGTVEVTRDYLIRVLRNGNQFHIDYLFGRSDNATADTDLIDIQDGTIYIGNGSIEGTDTCRAIAIKDTLARGQSKISLVVADGIRNSSNSTAYFKGKSGVVLEHCVFAGNVEVDRYAISSVNTLFSGAYDFTRTSTGEIDEINTMFRTSQAAEITVGSERTIIRNGSVINSSLVTIGNVCGTQSVAAVNSLTNATAYNFATIDMSNNATSIGVEVTMMLGRNSSSATVGSIYKIYYSACRDSAGNVTVATPIIDVSCLAEDSLTPALSADTNVSGTDVQLRVTQSSGATLGAIFEIKSMTIVNNSGGFNSLIS
jgi:hypothetical protein